MNIANICKVAQFTILCLLGCSTAWGQGTATQVVNQVLEEVIVATRATAVQIDFDGLPDVTPLDVTDPASNIKACKRTAKGLFCLVGNKVRRWTSLDELSTLPPAEEGVLALDCRDPNLVAGLNLDTKKSTTCTALTANKSGSVLWLGAKNKGKTHTLFKAVLKSVNGNCPDTSWISLRDYPYCAKQATTGRPLLVKIFYLDGNLGLGPGVLMLEERKTAAVWNEVAQAVTEIAAGKSDWNLIGNEKLLSIAATSWNDAPYILATTTKDRMLAVDAGTPDGFPVFNFVTHRNDLGSSPDFCGNGSAQHYDVTTGTDSGLVFATDQNFCLVLAMTASAAGANPFTLTQDVQTLSTDTGAPDIFPPSLVTAAPGISINLANCAGNAGCDLIENAATLTNVQLVQGQPTGMTLYQVKNIPDCRYIPQVCSALGLNLADVVIGPAGDPAAQILNLTELLPTEITDLFEAGELPDMYMSRRWRGQKIRIDENLNLLPPFRFEAFFGRTEDGVVFRSTFDGEFDVFALAGSNLGCQSTFPAETSAGEILQWDTVTTVSERYVSNTGTYEHTDTLINVDCGSSKTIDGRWSLKPYNTEITPCTRADLGDIWESDGVCPLPPSVDPETVVEIVDDAVFAKLLLSLYDDLGDAIDQVACMDVDGNGGTAPLLASVCGTAQAQWANGLDKLEKCWDATQQPKQSSGDQNCQAFVSQLTGLTSTLAGATSSGTDQANRVGELQARIAVITHVYEDRFVPSIPDNGFCEPGNPMYQPDQDCTAP